MLARHDRLQPQIAAAERVPQCCAVYGHCFSGHCGRGLQFARRCDQQPGRNCTRKIGQSGPNRIRSFTHAGTGSCGDSNTGSICAGATFSCAGCHTDANAGTDTHHTAFTISGAVCTPLSCTYADVDRFTDPCQYRHSSPDSDSHACAHTHAHAHSRPDSHACTHTHTHTHLRPHADADANTNSHHRANSHSRSHGHPDSHAVAHSNPYPYANADAKSDPCAAACGGLCANGHPDGRTGS